MFNFFNKKIPKESYVNERDLSNLSVAIKVLPPKYGYLAKQLTKKLMVIRRPNVSLGENWVSFDLDEAHLKKFENNRISNSMEIKGILIKSQSGKEFKLDLFIIPGGILGAYKIEPKIDIRDEKFVSANSENIKETSLSNETLDFFRSKINSEVTERVIEFLEMSDIFLIEEFDRKLVALKSDKNGNYICCDDSLDVFIIEHDPLQIRDTDLNLSDISHDDKLIELFRDF
ncbi:hypothetical protein [Ulvibacterium sp.]|uniref:hypothetical protein n=1 Tax=Ulvibacterium sp. TaxID=2665914 RepID=UPI003BAB0ED1